MRDEGNGGDTDPQENLDNITESGGATPPPPSAQPLPSSQAATPPKTGANPPTVSIENDAKIIDLKKKIRKRDLEWELAENDVTLSESMYNIRKNAIEWEENAKTRMEDERKDFKNYCKESYYLYLLALGAGAITVALLGYFLLLGIFKLKLDEENWYNYLLVATFAFGILAAVFFIATLLYRRKIVKPIDRNNWESETAFNLYSHGTPKPRIQRTIRLFRMHQKELQKYYDQARIQNLVIFLIGIFCIVMGFTTIGITFYLLWEFSKQDVGLAIEILTGAAGIVGAILQNFIGVIYLTMHHRSTDSMNIFHNRMVMTNRMFLGNLMAEGIVDKNGEINDKTRNTLQLMAFKIIDKINDQLDESQKLTSPDLTKMVEGMNKYIESHEKVLEKLDELNKKKSENGETEESK